MVSQSNPTPQGPHRQVAVMGTLMPHLSRLPGYGFRGRSSRPSGWYPACTGNRGRVYYRRIAGIHACRVLL